MIIETILKTILAVIILQILTKILGPREVSQLSFYDYIVGITLGSIAAVMCTDNSIEIGAPITAMVVFILLTFLEMKLTNKSIVARRLLTGKPSFIIYDGKIIQSNLNKHNLDIQDLLTECRCAGYYHIADVQYAIMETNGKLSILPKATKRNMTCEDAGYTPKKELIEANVIVDGNVMKEALESIHKDETWLNKQIKEHHFKDISEIILATADESNNITVFYKDITLENKDFFI